MAEFRYALFYDFHTMTTVPDVGAKFDAEAFTDQVKSCGVDFLTWHARCNQGNAYYNTREGVRHPSADLFHLRNTHCFYLLNHSCLLRDTFCPSHGLVSPADG